MPNLYNWVISQLECYPEHDGKENVVFTIHWRRQVSNGVHASDVYGSQEVTLNRAAPFTPFAKLTKEQVEGWLTAAMGAERIAELDANLDKQIAARISPPVMTPPIPWAG